MRYGKRYKKKKKKTKDLGQGSVPLGGSCEGGHISARSEIPSQVRARRGSFGISEKNTVNGTYTMINWNLSQGCKDSSIYANQSMRYMILTKYEGKNMIFAIDAEKVSTKFNTYL